MAEKKPRNNWNTSGMNSNWRKLCPLNGAERYLWKKLQQFPHYDWREQHPEKTADHQYYESGWETLHFLQDRLFSSGSSHGDHRGLFKFNCEWEGCREPSNAILNNSPDGEWLDDAPRFYCHPHYHEFFYGEKYVPPTREETLRMRALFKAIHQTSQERPAQETEIMGGLKCMTLMMDKPYLERMVELAEEEYQKICEEKTQ